MSKLNEIQQRLSEIDATRFHKLVDSYLSKKYNYSIHSTGTKTGEDKPRKGTPDTLITLDNGYYIFVEYTTQKTKIKDKFIDDIKKCLEPKKTGIEISKIDKIILACNSSLQSDDIEALKQACNSIKCEVITNSTLSYDLVNHYPAIAKEFWGIDIGNILTPNILKEKYLNNFKTISLLANDKKPIDDIFINLAIIKEEEKKKDNPKLINREPILSSYEEIHKPKEPIAIKELINTSKKSLIYGKAGIGKTTLCKYIAYKWAKEELYQEFEYIIYIALREWKTKGLKGAIKDNYYSQDEEKITLDIKANNSKMLFLFDGYDELDSDKKKDLTKEIEHYGLSHYIITTRPYGYQKSDFRVNEYFETIGFTGKDVAKYVDAFFKENNDKAKSLKAYLETNISIKHIGYIPLMLEMICLQWEQKEFSESLTMTELYSQSIENIFFEYTEKNGTAYIQDKEEEIFNYLGKIAFEGLKQQTIILDKKIIKEKRSFFSDYVLKAGFLNDGKAEKSNPLLNSYQFPHLTFQEYFSALYVSKLEPQEQSEIIRDWKFYPHMQMFFAFLGGLIGDKEFLLQEIESEPKDLVGFYEFFLILYILCEIKTKSLNKNILITINDNLIKWIEIGNQNKLYYNFSLEKYKTIINDKSINYLIDIIKDKSIHFYYRDVFIQFIINIKRDDDKTINALINIIRDESINTSNMKIIEYLISIEVNDDKLINSLINIIKDDSICSYYRGEIVESLANIKKNDYKIIDTFITIIKDDNINILVKSKVANCLAKIGNSNNDFLINIMTIIKNKSINPYYRGKISKSLIENEKENNKVIDALVTILKDKTIEFYIMDETAKSLANIGINDDVVFDILISILQDKKIDYYDQEEAFKALINLGINNKSTNSLIKIFQEEDRDFRLIVIIAKYLIDIGIENNFIDSLIDSLENKNIDFEYRVAIALLLIDIGINNDKAIETLMYCIKNKNIDADGIHEVVWSLRDIKRNDNEFIDTLITIIKDESINSYDRSTIVKSLINISRKDNIFINNLIAIIKDNNIDFEIRSEIVQSLEKIGLDDNKLIHILMTIIKDKNINSEIRSDIAQSLAKIGIYDNEVINTLIAFIKEEKVMFPIDFTILNFLSIQILFDNYDKENISLEIIKQKILNNTLPLYLKNKKLHTIENGKEISTQREVDEATLNEIKMMLRGEGLNG